MKLKLMLALMSAGVMSSCYAKNIQFVDGGDGYICNCMEGKTETAERVVMDSLSARTDADYSKWTAHCTDTFSEDQGSVSSIETIWADTTSNAEEFRYFQYGITPSGYNPDAGDNGIISLIQIHPEETVDCIQALGSTTAIDGRVKFGQGSMLPRAICGSEDGTADPTILINDQALGVIDGSGYQDMRFLNLQSIRTVVGGHDDFTPDTVDLSYLAIISHVPSSPDKDQVLAVCASSMKDYEYSDKQGSVDDMV